MPELFPCTPLLLAGPTAVGKSAVAMLLAERLGGEIISVDSMQVYRGLDIGTAKPTLAEQQRVPHHLIDILDLDRPFDVAQFCEQAKMAIQGIQARGKIPILCGGTGLYFKAWLEGLGQTPITHPGLRAELEATPLAALLPELAAKDPVTYERIDRQNPRRVVRAIEVIRLTGRPFSEQRAEWQNPAKLETKPKAPFFVLHRATPDLHVRMAARVEAMFAEGLVAETHRLLERGLEQNRAALQAIGYRQVVEHLRGERSLADTVELVKSRTRQFAKRQVTWFKKQTQAKWIGVAFTTPVEETTETLISNYRSWMAVDTTATGS
jgi:tRNA dimethylallyltransferase